MGGISGHFLRCLEPLLQPTVPWQEEVGTTGLVWGLDLMEPGKYAECTLDATVPGYASFVCSL